jgi:DNA modification methylase
MRYEIIQGDCRDILAGVTVVNCAPFHRVQSLDLPDNSIDAIVTDPPYGLSFMCRDWDQEVPGPDYWRAVYRVAKPGAHLLAFGGTRTFHRLACAIEDSGWIIRDCLMWLYGSGFPKSHNIALGIDKKYGAPNRGRAIPTASSFQACDTDRENLLTSNPVEQYRARTPEAAPWVGFGTALKPAWEPIILARKPFRGSVADNVLEHGTGALHIDAGRINGNGRWPANLVLDESAAAILDDQSGAIVCHPMIAAKSRGLGYSFKGPASENVNIGGGDINVTYGDTGGASRFFYTAKASREEREGGLDGPEETVSDGRAKPADNAYQRGKTKRKNLHPTVKPLELMRWLVRLITSPGGTVLDPFCGSGSTVAAAMIEGFNAIGIEIDPIAVEIARKRAAFAKVQAGTATTADADKLAGPVQLGLLGIDK